MRNALVVVITSQILVYSVYEYHNFVTSLERSVHLVN
jgi:hypothetical protein